MRAKKLEATASTQSEEPTTVPTKPKIEELRQQALDDLL